MDNDGYFEAFTEACKDIADLRAVNAELLDALEKILAHVEDMDLDRNGTLQCTLCHTYRMIGHNAISRARG